MAIFYTAQATLQNEEVDAKRASGELLHGRLRVATVRYTADGNQAADDIIKLVKFDHPVMIHPHLSYVHTSAALGASTATLDIGDDSDWDHITPDPDRYADGINVGDTGIDLFTAPAVPAAESTPYTTTKGGWVEALIKTLTGTASSSAILTFKIVYSIN